MDTGDYNSGKNRGMENLRPFEKGMSGNPNGRPPGKSLTTLLNEAMSEEGYTTLTGVELLDDDGLPTGKMVAVRLKIQRSAVVIHALVKQAAKGNIRAIELILERLEGKVRQGFEHSLRSSEPITGMTLMVVESAEQNNNEEDEN